MTVRNLTHTEFSAEKAAGKVYVPDNDGFYLDDAEYVEITTPAFSDNRGTLKYDHVMTYRRVR